MTAPVADLAVLVASVAGLWLGARTLVDASVRLARRAGLSDLVVGLTVVAVGTSSPELVVTARAALAGLGNVAVGNVVGSNVFNLAGVLGVVSLVRVVPVQRSLVRRDGAALVLATLLGGAALLDLTVSRPEGLVLVGTLVAYTWYLLRTGGDSVAGDESVDGDGDVADGRVDGEGAADDATTGGEATGPADREPTDRSGTDAPDATAEPPVPQRLLGRVAVPDGVLVVAGLAVLLVGGDLLVASASSLARTAGISEFVIGGTVVAAGTSTPELAVSLVAMGRGSAGVSLGNVVGSSVFNLLGVMGVGAVLAPLSVVPAALGSVAWLAALVAVTVAALWSGRELTRPEGALLALSEAVRWTLGLLGLLG